MKGKLPTTFELTGLYPAPPQQYGGVRLIPLLRPAPRDDLRLALRRHEPDQKRLTYAPHGLVLSWSDDGSPVTPFGTQLGSDGPSSRHRDPWVTRLAHKPAQRQSERALRFLPLHLAIEGFLMLHHGGPEIAWGEYSRQARQHGLLLPSEVDGPGVSGRQLGQLDEALRVFEIHDRQCGVLVLVGDALASVFVVPHPADYRLLHRTLVEDSFGELILQYSQLYLTVPELDFSLPDPATPLTSLAALQSWVEAAQSRWIDDSRLFTQGLLGRPVSAKPVYQTGPFLLSRFYTALDLNDENHLGEAIIRDDGTVEYLKTFRLSAAQTRRAHLLEFLHTHHWELDAAALSVGKHRGQLVYQLVNAGLGYLLSEPVLRAARRSS